MTLMRIALIYRPKDNPPTTQYALISGDTIVNDAHGWPLLFNTVADLQAHVAAYFPSAYVEVYKA